MRIGVDIVEVKRIGNLVKDENFLNRVFTPEEQKYCLAKKNCAQHFAVRFAAKEAVWKALGKSGVALLDIGVKNKPDGKPEVTLRGKRYKNIDISLSHTDDYAVAAAIINKSGSR